MSRWCPKRAIRDRGKKMFTPPLKIGEPSNVQKAHAVRWFLLSSLFFVCRWSRPTGRSLARDNQARDEKSLIRAWRKSPTTQTSFRALLVPFFFSSFLPWTLFGGKEVHGTEHWLAGCWTISGQKNYGEHVMVKRETQRELNYHFEVQIPWIRTL